MTEQLSKLYGSLPPWVQQSPAIVLLLLVIVGLMSGYLVTGRTFDREMNQCHADAALYKRIAFNAVGFLNEERAKKSQAPAPLKDAEPRTLAEQLEADERAAREGK